MQQLNRQKKGRSRGRKPAEGLEASATELAGYIVDILNGMRGLTQGAEQKDVRFLDYLLAMTAAEAAKVAERQYH